MAARNPTDRIVAIHDEKLGQARKALKTIKVKTLTSVPQLREAVARLLEALGIEYDKTG